ncbi:aminotransferase class V-fold PLP-dependent enzyme [Chryseolinea sp. T2]|uniref:aminotransferase class V-fold PLP-dependent enzyme n=1 Tax=Chryseolinea sp. T2 TaxID=3129255 RepID=UPI00307783AE
MATPKINFTPGPSQLYFTVEDHAKVAFREGIPSLSHRSKKFESIYKDASDGLRELLGIPSNFHVLFTGSATEVWERIIQNLVERKSVHLVNGSFSKKFYEIALQLGRAATSIEVTPGLGFSDQLQVSDDTELIAVTQNETSTGVSTPLQVLSELRKKHPNSLIAVDAVSSLPYPDFDYNGVDTVFFSVQKGFGLPAGLGVWLVNERCVEKANALLAKNISIGSYHNLPSLIQHEAKYQTPETPNVLGIYLLAKVVEDMLRVGVHKIRKDTEYKAALLYNELNAHATIRPFVSDKALQSRTVIVAATGNATKALTDRLLENGIQPGDGYGPAKATQLRFANFPTHGKEQYELLCDIIKAF